MLMLSVVMLVIGTVFFSILTIAAYFAQTHSTRGQIGGWALLLWLGSNILSYIVVLFLHEGIHLSLIHISEPTRRGMISYAVF
ncbi:MAG TPA: hypothetical protein DHV65_08465, partial [Ktedonobacter sp.]|nr:hypothetical protein [Ktedonobacter sp.]